MEEFKKLDPTAIIATKLSSIERLSAIDFIANFNTNSDKFEFIIRFSGNIKELAKDIEFDYIELFNGFAIIYINENKLDKLINNNRILYIDKPKRVFYEDINLEASLCCMDYKTENSNQTKLDGSGTIMAIIDSGFDLSHAAFKNIDIISIWDQNKDGISPYNYKIGSLVNSTTDETGHGTSVADIIYKLVPGCKYIFVKLMSGKNSTSNSAALLMAIDYVIKVSLENNLPITINLSYGNNYGDHNGNSSLEQYIDACKSLGKITFVCGMGNEGNKSKHALIRMIDNIWYKREILVNNYQSYFNVQLWKSYSDNIDIYLILPNGAEIGPFNKTGIIYDYYISGMRIFVVLSEFSSFSEKEQIFISVIPINNYVLSGIWEIKIKAKMIFDGRIDMWLPVDSLSNSDISFIQASEITSYTIPASSQTIISVGAYNPINLSYTAFSGRGYTVNNLIKPDICAPGVNIDVAIPGNLYTKKSGTSFATPFVSAAVACLMQWGITDKNDVYMFGEKVKNTLIRGATKLPGIFDYPNNKTGYGALCLKNSINLS